MVGIVLDRVKSWQGQQIFSFTKHPDLFLFNEYQASFLGVELIRAWCWPLTSV